MVRLPRTDSKVATGAGLVDESTPVLPFVLPVTASKRWVASVAVGGAGAAVCGGFPRGGAALLGGSDLLTDRGREVFCRGAGLALVFGGVDAVRDDGETRGVVLDLAADFDRERGRDLAGADEGVQIGSAVEEHAVGEHRLGAARAPEDRLLALAVILLEPVEEERVLKEVQLLAGIAGGNVVVAILVGVVLRLG